MAENNFIPFNLLQDVPEFQKYIDAKIIEMCKVKESEQGLFSNTPKYEVKTMRDIKEMVKNKKVSFEYYRDGELWYTTECGFKFPVPISDTGTGIFKAEDKAILFMRYIRKHKEKIEEALNNKDCGLY